MTYQGAKRLEIILEENSDFAWNFRLRTSTCSVISITGYGARLHIRDKEEGSLLISASHTTYITVNTTVHEFQIDIPSTIIAGQKEVFRANNFKGVWDFVVFPGASTPTADPIALAYGPVRFRRGVTDLS
jgi:hypothetical protein